MGKKEQLIGFIKHQVNVDITPFVDDKWSKRGRYLNVDTKKMSKTDLRKIELLQNTSKNRFSFTDNGGVGTGFVYEKDINKSYKDLPKENKSNTPVKPVFQSLGKTRGTGNTSTSDT